MSNPLTRSNPYLITEIRRLTSEGKLVQDVTIEGPVYFRGGYVKVTDPTTNPPTADCFDFITDGQKIVEIESKLLLKFTARQKLLPYQRKMELIKDGHVPFDEVVIISEWKPIEPDQQELVERAINKYIKTLEN